MEQILENIRTECEKILREIEKGEQIVKFPTPTAEDYADEVVGVGDEKEVVE
uniref:Uncharacterized protein n=1 Tax=viral metagenome TaxID=1070528 RepID=A0A6M3Y525_9ZZZZ